VLILDDLIATFGTIERAATALTKAGARRVLAFAAHGLFVSPAAESLLRAPVERVFVTDTVPLFRLTAPAARKRVEALTCTGLFAAEIRKQHAAWC
jgi:ribose-phosphate pyrophosphokinase